MSHEHGGIKLNPTPEQRQAYAEAVMALLLSPCVSGEDAMARIERVDEALRFTEVLPGVDSVEERASLEAHRRKVYNDITHGRWPDAYRQHARLAPLGN